MERTHRNSRAAALAVVLVLLGAWALVDISGCASTPPDRIAYNTIDGATRGVQAAVSAYKRHCNVAPGAQGPGACPAVEYQKVQDAYVKYQGVALTANSVASHAGQTPLDIINAAAADALSVVNLFLGGQ